MLFVSDPNLRSGGQIMITVDILSWLMYTQLVLSVVLFFALQLVVLLAHDKFEHVGDWIVYRGTWYGIIFQCLSIAILALLVFQALIDHTRVTYTGVLIVLNTAWFTTLRLSFLLVDYRYSRQMRRKEQ